MWTLRRTSNSMKNRGFSLGTSIACSARSEVRSCYVDDRAGTGEKLIAERSFSLERIYSIASDYPKFFMGRCSFSSQAGAESSGEEDDHLEEGFSELETPEIAEPVQVKDAEDELILEPELSEEDSDDDDDSVVEPQSELGLSDIDTEVTEKRSPRKRIHSALLKPIMDAPPGTSIYGVLDKWVNEGNDWTRAEVSLVMLNLRKRRMYGKALQLSEWLESTGHLGLIERDYASHVDLIAKARDIQKAENYIEKIPKSFRGEVVYRTLLANCVATNNMAKAEEVFNRMKNLQLPITSFAYNQLLLLYKRLDKKKIADVLLLMENENVKPTLFTYRILIDAKGQSNDINGMDLIVERMKGEGIELDLNTQAILARHYVSGGLREKAEAVLKEMEGSNTKENRWACRSLLPLYGALGKADDVRRLWKICEANPRPEECIAAIEAWGKLNKIEEAEEVFDKMLKKWGKLSSRHYSTLLKVYADHKMLTKGKDLVKKMGDNGCQIGPLTWDALVKLFVEAGEVEKADSVLQRAAQQSRVRPMFSSYMAIMYKYADRGDIHNSEKMFHRMRQAGYVARKRQFETLVQAYINAKAPAYGIRERMKADGLFPNRAIAGMLSQVDAFKKTAVSDLLD